MASGTNAPERFLDIAELRELSRRRPGRAALAIARQWAVILAAAAGAVYGDRWYGYLLAIVVIATRQHALAVLMHDGAHRLLFADRRVNDLVSDLLLAFPLFISTTLISTPTATRTATRRRSTTPPATGSGCSPRTRSP